MILVDTSVWIEFLKAHEPIHSQLSLELEKGQIIAAEAVFGELLQGIKSKKEGAIILAYWQNLKHPETHPYWIDAGILSNQLKLINKGVGLIDAYIMAITRKEKHLVWTLDKKLLSVLHKSETFHF